MIMRRYFSPIKKIINWKRIRDAKKLKYIYLYDFDVVILHKIRM
jgi:hypothetical protein